MVKTKRKREEEKRNQKGENNESKEGGRRVGDLEWGKRSSKIQRRDQENWFLKVFTSRSMSLKRKQVKEY